MPFAFIEYIARMRGSPWQKSRASVRRGIGPGSRRRDEAVLTEIRARLDNVEPGPMTQATTARLLPRAATRLQDRRHVVFRLRIKLEFPAVTEWCRHFGHRPPTLKPGRPAVLDNFRLCFPIFSEYYGGGIADIVYDPGKYVAGALFDLSEADLKVLDAKVGRRHDPATDKEIGAYSRTQVKVSPLGKGEQIPAMTYQGVSVEKYHIPPTKHYMDLVVQGGLQFRPVDDVDFVPPELQHAGRPQAAPAGVWGRRGEVVK